MRHDVGPLYMRIRYGSTGAEHSMTLPLNWKTADGQPEIGVPPALLRGDESTGTVIPAATWTADLFAAIASGLSTSQSLAAYDLWWKASASDRPVWIFGDSISSGAGSYAHAPVPGAQMTMTFRTRGGGRFRLVYLDTPFGQDQKFYAADLTGSFSAFAAVVAYLTAGETRVVVGRDGFSLVGLIRGLSKENDNLRKKLMR